MRSDQFPRRAVKNVKKIKSSGQHCNFLRELGHYHGCPCKVISAPSTTEYFTRRSGLGLLPGSGVTLAKLRSNCCIKNLSHVTLVLEDANLVRACDELSLVPLVLPLSSCKLIISILTMAKRC